MSAGGGATLMPMFTSACAGAAESRPAASKSAISVVSVMAHPPEIVSGDLQKCRTGARERARNNRGLGAWSHHRRVAGCPFWRAADRRCQSAISSITRLESLRCSLRSSLGPRPEHGREHLHEPGEGSRAGRRGPEDERYGWKDTDLWAKSARASAELAPLLRSVARWARRARSWPSRRGVEDDAKREAMKCPQCQHDNPKGARFCRRVRDPAGSEPPASLFASSSTPRLDGHDPCAPGPGNAPEQRREFG